MKQFTKFPLFTKRDMEDLMDVIEGQFYQCKDNYTDSEEDEFADILTEHVQECIGSLDDEGDMSYSPQLKSAVAKLSPVVTEAISNYVLNNF